jgi:hypothetical protein
MPEMWSLCSWVIKIAEMLFGSMPASASRFNVDFKQSPTSTKIEVSPLEMYVMLPLLPLERV